MMHTDIGDFKVYSRVLNSNYAGEGFSLNGI